ncbi:MAG TPA: VWA domain-containing protein [Acidimicrobiales bacterium]|nr:VWA domain-containing protein [Acidimicrobiales bacterium]
MLDVLTGFVAELRRAGLPVSVTEAADAAEAIRHLPLEDRQAIKYALGATLVKSSSHWRAFDTAFEVYFSMRGPQYGLQGDDLLGPPSPDGEEAPAGQGDRRGQGQEGAGGGDMVTPEEIAAMLYRALRDGDNAMLSAVARLAVGRYAGMEPGRPVGGTYYLYRTLRSLDLDSVLSRLLTEARQGAVSTDTEQETGAGPPGAILRGEKFGPLTPLEQRLLEDEYKARIDELRREIEAEIRRRLVADRGVEALARSLRKPLPEDVDFMHASRDELVQIRKAIQPLARKLQARLARKRRHLRRGALDFRSTMRHSLSYGGVPAEPRFRHPKPSKPEIFVVADISGSVAAFARFTLHLVHAIAAQFSQVRSFVFIDGIDEVTQIFDRSETVGEAIHRVNQEADVVWVDGHSDYGHALNVFWTKWGKDVGPKTSIILLGDARSNYHAPESWVVRELQRRARHVYWLNPEPRSYWGSGDSIVEQYAQYCDGVFECRNLRQLEGFVETLV